MSEPRDDCCFGMLGAVAILTMAGHTGIEAVPENPFRFEVVWYAGGANREWQCPACKRRWTMTIEEEV